MFTQYRSWPQKIATVPEGVIVGVDINQEWLLPWWWDHYSKDNPYPVAFFDFGMSDGSKQWCKDRGRHIPLQMPDTFVAERGEMSLAQVQAMEAATGKDFWPSRPSWFKKPLACLQTPFDTSVWIDLDCQVQASLRELFALCGAALAIAKENSTQLSDHPLQYNSGVIGFRRGQRLIETWANACLDRNHEYRGDQDVLSALIRAENPTLHVLPPRFNWSRTLEDNPEALILHWHGPHGKAVIAHQIAAGHLRELI